jgi:hypothetical protein
MPTMKPTDVAGTPDTAIGHNYASSYSGCQPAVSSTGPGASESSGIPAPSVPIALLSVLKASVSSARSVSESLRRCAP